LRPPGFSIFVKAMRDIKRIDTVILAAGSSSRLGVNKLLLTVDGVPVLKRTLSHFLALQMGVVFVVTGFDRERVEGLLRDAPVLTIHNPLYEEGMSASVKAALPLLGEADGVFFHLGDKPFVQRETLQAMVDAFGRTRHSIIMPLFQGQKGHPVLLDVKPYLAEMHVLQGDTALRPVIENHSQDILYVEGDEGITLDLDTDEDIDRLRRRGYTIEKAEG
jgi:molybdenum cofactor cytidylyltransferase